MMQQFSDAFKARVVQRLVGPRAMSANALAEEVGVSQESLSRWLRAARSVGGMISASVLRVCAGDRRHRSWVSTERTPSMVHQVAAVIGARAGV